MIDLTDKVTVEKLVSSASKGDRKSQQQLHQMFYGKMLSACMRYTDDIDDAKDILQDGFLKVFNNLKLFENKGSLEGWVRRIIVNTAIDSIRKNKELFVELNDDRTLIIDDHDEDLEMQQYQHLQAETIIGLIQKLSPVYKTVFNLYVIENYSHKEIAEQLNISIGTSKSNLAKAKMNLKKLFENHTQNER
jgi:RNA polymerase sigma-70 factor, ECF subfamily